MQQKIIPSSGVKEIWSTYIIGGLAYLLLFVGPLWPIGRLWTLSRGPTAADGITNPRAERMFSIVALVALCVLAWCGWAVPRYGHPVGWIGVAMGAGGLYGIMTGEVFGKGIEHYCRQTVQWCTLPIVFVLVLLPDKDAESGGAMYDTAIDIDPELKRAEDKQRAFVLLTALFLVALAVAAVTTGFDALQQHFAATTK